MRLSKSHRAYFEAARSVAQLSDFPRIKIGAVAIYKHRIVSSGCNSIKTDTLQKKYNIYRFTEESKHCQHAELACLKPLIGRKDIDFKNVELYVYREYKNGDLAMCRPCPSCLALIRSLGIRHIHYTGDKSYIYEELFY
jgi:deoxycytidylate deaminase